MAPRAVDPAGARVGRQRPDAAGATRLKAGSGHAASVCSIAWSEWAEGSSVGREDDQRLGGAIDGTEPVGPPCVELDGFAFVQYEVVVLDDQAHGALEDVQPLVSFVAAWQLPRAPTSSSA
jgi:hypothetical protein